MEYSLRYRLIWHEGLIV